MKIVQAVGWFHPDSVGGTENYVARLAHRLRELNHDVLVVAPDAATQEPRRYEHDGIPVYRYPIPARPSRDEAQGRRRVRGTQHFDAWIQRQRPDVVHMHTFVTGLGLDELIAAKDAGAATVVTTHSASLGYLCQRGTMMRWGASLCDGIVERTKCASCELQHRGVPKAAARVLGRFASRSDAAALPGRIGTLLSIGSLIDWNVRRQHEMMRSIDRFVVLTQWGCDAVIANGAPRHKVLLNPLGIERSACVRKPPAAGRPLTVGFFSRFEAIKGAEVLARACAALPRGCEIAIEFRGPVASAHERSVHASVRAIIGSDPRVRFAPAVEPAEAGRVLAGYDVVVCPSMVLEGGPTVALEAMAAGTPVIASALGGIAELIEDGQSGRLLPPGDSAVLAAALAEIARDPSIVDRWRRALPAARTMAEVARDYVAVYDALVPHAASRTLV